MSPMLSSCGTLLSLAPPGPGNFSPAALRLRIKQPSAVSSSSAVALPRAAPYKMSRAPRLVCHAHTYDILPNALLHPPVADPKSNWRIHEDKNHIILMFDVGEETKEGDLKVTTTKDQALNVWLHIRYMGDGTGKSEAILLDARLQMPPGCDGKNVTKAEICNGTLQINIAKPKPENKDIKVTKGIPPVVHEGTQD